MSAPPYMQFYVGDYLADTMRLTTMQHGAYLLLLCNLWRAGGELPYDDGLLSQLTKLRPAQWRDMKPTLMPFFRVENGMLSQGRLTAEFQRAAHSYETKKQNGAHGGKPKHRKTKEAGLAGAKRSLIYTEPEPEREINLSAPSAAERDLSLSNEQAQSRFRSPDGERACAPVLRLVTEKGPSEGSQTDGPAWMAKRPSEMTPEERLLAKA